MIVDDNDEALMITVKDNGAGMPASLPDDLHKHGFAPCANVCPTWAAR